MRYGLLEDGDIIQENDEVFSFSGWLKIDSTVLGLQYRTGYLPVRRLIDRPKPPEVYTVPFGTWEGCIGEVFMDGTSKKVRLQNVFVGGERHVIDFPRRGRYDSKHFILEDDEIIVQGDKFVSHLGEVNYCQMTIGMTVNAATKKHTAVKLILRPVS